jgi:hypothetical protein
MATTFTSQLRFSLLNSGNTNTWGKTLNTGVDLAESAIAGVARIDVTTSDKSLTVVNGGPDQARCAVIQAVGNPGTARTIIFPNTTKMFVAVNDTDPVAPVTFATSVGGVTLNNSQVALMWVDSSSNMVKSVGPGVEYAIAATSLTSYTFATVPVSGTFSVLIMKSGNLVTGLCKMTTTPSLATGTIVLNSTGVSFPAALSPPANRDFPVVISEAGVLRECFLRVPITGTNWSINRLAPATFGALATRAWVSSGYLPFSYGAA